MEKIGRILMSFLLFAVCASMNAQKIEASGTVIDDMGEPVMMATVVQKGTGNGTTTDMEGHFSLQVDKGATLVISFIGYESVEMPASPNMNITLKDNAKELAEVVVTGYQERPKYAELHAGQVGRC